MKVKDCTKKALLELPQRSWDTQTEYDSLLIFSSGRKHESGWNAMTIVGCCDTIPKEVCTTWSDDIEWRLPEMRRFGPRNEYAIGQMRTDCTGKAGILHVWCHSGKFLVGHALSSISVELVLNPAKPNEQPLLPI